MRLQIPGWVVVVLGVLATGAAPALAQTGGARTDRPFEVGAGVTTLAISEVDVTNVGVSLQAGWRVGPVLAIDGALEYFPGGNDGAFLSVDGQRKVLALAGVRARVDRGRVSVFARVRPGALRFVSEDRAACIAIAVFPLPLACRLLAGDTAFAADLGGGVHVDLTADRRTYLSIDVSDLLLRYEGEVWRRRGRVATGAFVTHNARVAVGLGWRF